MWMSRSSTFFWKNSMVLRSFRFTVRPSSMTVALPELASRAISALMSSTCHSGWYCLWKPQISAGSQRVKLKRHSHIQRFRTP